MLVLRALGLGDLLVAVPALRALRRWADVAHPGAELVLACPRALEPVLGVSGSASPYAGSRPLADRVLDLDARDASGLHGLEAAWNRCVDASPRVAVNLHGSGPESHRALGGLQPQRLVAFGCSEADVDGPPWESVRGLDEHETVRWCRLVTTVLDAPADPADLHLDPPRCEPLAAGAVVVHPGAASRSRRWPVGRWAQVIRALAAHGHRVVLTGGPDEVGLADEVRRRSGLTEDAVIAGRTDLGQLAAAVAAARLVLCGDTGIAHLASAYRTPSVVLFGPTAPVRWGPPAVGPHTVLWHGRGTGEGDPHGATPDPTLLEVTVEEVVAAARARLAGSTPGQVRPPGGRTTPASV